MTRESVLQADAKMDASVDTHCSPMASARAWCVLHIQGRAFLRGVRC
jgi:hypothetical protein